MRIFCCVNPIENKIFIMNSAILLNRTEIICTRENNNRSINNILSFFSLEVVLKIRQHQYYYIVNIGYLLF
jgi:hypothetical protein